MKNEFNLYLIWCANWPMIRFKLIWVCFYFLSNSFFQTTDWLIGSSSALLIILRLVENRQVILTLGVDKIILQQLSKPNQNFQLQYQLVCCLWFISFNHAPELAQNSTLIGTHRFWNLSSFFEGYSSYRSNLLFVRP